MDYLASMYIDNEMNLEEKKRFVEKVRSDGSFYAQTLELLEQESLLREIPALPVAAFEKSRRPSFRMTVANFFKPFSYAAAGFAVAVLLFFSFYDAPATAPQCANRFVLFEPAAGRVELTGTFTGWQRVPMQQVGDSGYWELTLPLPTGEHRFAYILDGKHRMADPTVPASERDDFGGENSILNTEAAI
ncbi:MAG: glycogen-binding domain-containing protein [Desulfobacterales bacterium]